MTRSSKRIRLPLIALSTAVTALLLGAAEIRSPGPTSPGVQTTDLVPTSESTYQPTWMRLTKLTDGFRVDGSMPASSEGPRTIRFSIDPWRGTYTAVVEPLSDHDKKVLDRFPNPEIGDPPPDKCEDLCAGTRTVLMSTDDPIMPLVTSIITSSWDVYSDFQHHCRWESYGNNPCYVEAQHPPLTHWSLANRTGSFPSGAYKHLNHSSYCNFINYDWHNVNLPTGTTHTLTLTRYPGVFQTTIGFSYTANGEDYFLLGYHVSDNGGSNSCD